MAAKKKSGKDTSAAVARKAAKALKDPASSADEKSVAASALAQVEPEAPTTETPAAALERLLAEAGLNGMVVVSKESFDALAADLDKLREENRTLAEQLDWHKRQAAR